MRLAQSHEGGHAAETHSADPHAGHVELLTFRECSKEWINLADRLQQDVPCSRGRLEFFRESLAMTGEINRTGADSGAHPAKVAAGVQFLVDGSTMKPENNRRLGGPRPIRMYEENRNLVFGQPQDARVCAQRCGELIEWLRHAADLSPHMVATLTDMTVRIIGGEFRSRSLQTPVGAETTRPMAARVKESIFNLLRGWFEGANVLDLFAGVGTMGLEAVSRGASRVVMVEQNRKIHDLLRANIESLGCSDRATAHLGDALSPSVLYAAPKPVDVLFIDPPYNLMRTKVSRERVLQQVRLARAILRERSFVVLRVPLQEDEIQSEGELTIPGFDGPEIHRYGRDMLVCLYMPSHAEESGGEIAQHDSREDAATDSQSAVHGSNDVTRTTEATSE